MKNAPTPPTRTSFGGLFLRTLVVAALLAATVLIAERLTRLQSRLDQVEISRRNQSTVFRKGLEEVQNQLGGIRIELATSFSEIEEASGLVTRLAEAENALQHIGETVERQSSDLTTLELAQAEVGSGLEETLEDRWNSMNELIATTQNAAFESQRRIEEISSQPDLEVMWRELVGPVVQLAGDTSVGSGVLLPSTWDEDEGHYHTYLLTAWHVVRDIQGDLSKTDMPVPVNVYLESGDIQPEAAKLLVFNAELDAALLELRTEEPFANGAALASREHLQSTKIFDEVYAVGCPLGNDPIPTHGEVATLRHEVDGETYWMINAPTYIGNSGGGIFNSPSHELLGIFSKIYTHGSLRPTIVPHMGLVTPLTAIYDWLEGEGYAKLIPKDVQAKVASASGH